MPALREGMQEPEYIFLDLQLCVYRSAERYELDAIPHLRKKMKTAGRLFFFQFVRGLFEPKSHRCPSRQPGFLTFFRIRSFIRKIRSVTAAWACTCPRPSDSNGFGGKNRTHDDALAAISP